MDKMKKTYNSPKVRIAPLAGPTVLVQGSNSVTEYRQGDNIAVGDDD